jgi:uncharacterized membrane protein YbhN (UPF0104 family)
MYCTTANFQPKEDRIMSHLKDAFGRLKTFSKSKAGHWTWGVISLTITAVMVYLSWPQLSEFPSFIATANIALLLGAVAAFAASQAFDALSSWLVCQGQRPKMLTMTGCTAVVQLIELALPSEIAEVAEAWLMHKIDGTTLKDSGTALVTTGLLLPAAMAPFSFVAAFSINPLTALVRDGLIVYGILGFVLLAVLLVLPVLEARHKLAKIPLVNKLSGSLAPPKQVMICLVANLGEFGFNCLGCYLLLRAVSPAGSFELMLAVMCIANVTSIIPIGSAAQAGGSVVVMTAAGIAGFTAVNFSVATQLVIAVSGLAFILTMFIAKRLRDS